MAYSIDGSALQTVQEGPAITAQEGVLKSRPPASLPADLGGRLSRSAHAPPSIVPPGLGVPGGPSFPRSVSWARLNRLSKTKKNTP